MKEIVEVVYVIFKERLFLTDSRQIASVKLDEVARKHFFQFMP